MAYLVVNRFFKAIHNKSLSSTFECPCVEATKLFSSPLMLRAKKLERLSLARQGVKSAPLG